MLNHIDAIPAGDQALDRLGSTLRLGVPKPGGDARYVHCQTSLTADLALVAGGALRFEGNRAVLFAPGATVPSDLIGLLIRRALTWHRRRASG